MGDNKYKQSHKEQGLCYQCSRSAEPGKTQCIVHLDTERKRINLRRIARVEEGKCPTCNRPKHPEIDEGYWKCITCRQVGTWNLLSKNFRPLTITL
jgi:hypothetical protein